MDGNENNFDMPHPPGLLVPFEPHLQEDNHVPWVQVAPNDDPGNVEHRRDTVGQGRCNFGRTVILVDASTADQKPCVDLNRQDDTHQPP